MSTIPPITGIPIIGYPDFTPYTQITPFTVRDGATYLLTLESLKDWIRDVLVPQIDAQIAGLGDAWSADITDVVNQTNAIIAQMITEVNAVIAQMTDQVGQANAAADAAHDSEVQAGIYASTVVAIQDTAVQGLINNVASLTRQALELVFADKSVQVTVETGRLSITGLDTTIKNRVVLSTGLNVLDFGAVGDGVHDDTSAIQTAVNALGQGQALIFPFTGVNKFYTLTSTILITTPNVRLVGQPRDGYAMSIRTAVAGMTMFKVQAPSVVFENMALFGQSDLTGNWANGLNCIAAGIELFGDTDGNVDADIKGCTFQYLATGVILHGRNATIRENLFSNVLTGVMHIGKDPVYHTGVNADQNRGHAIRNNRFHNIGIDATTSAVLFTEASKVLHAIVAGNHFDSNGFGAHIWFIGTSTDPARGLSIVGNKHTECSNTPVLLNYAQYPLVSDFTIIGASITNAYDAIRLDNCLYPLIAGGIIRLTGRHGIIGQNNSGVMIDDVKIIQVGQTPGQQGNAVDFDNTNTNVNLDNVRGSTGTGWFFNGSPITTIAAIHNCAWESFTLGGVNSKTMLNHSRRGQNAYIEGPYGRIEDTGYGQYALAANTALTIANVQIGANFGAFILAIEIAGRNATSGHAYFIGSRVIRNENGTPVIVVVGADTTSGLTVNITSTGAQTFSITAQTTAAAEIGVKVRAGSAGGASGMASANLTVTMAAQ